MAQSDYGKQQARFGAASGAGSFRRIYDLLAWLFVIAAVTAGAGVLVGLFSSSTLVNAMTAAGALVAAATLAAGKAIARSMRLP